MTDPGPALHPPYNKAVGAVVPISQMMPGVSRC